MKLGDMPFGWRLLVFPLLLVSVEVVMAFVVVYWLATDRPIMVRITDKEGPAALERRALPTSSVAGRETRATRR